MDETITPEVSAPTTKTALVAVAGVAAVAVASVVISKFALRRKTQETSVETVVPAE